MARIDQNSRVRALQGVAGARIPGTLFAIAAILTGSACGNSGGTDGGNGDPTTASGGAIATGGVPGAGGGATGGIAVTGGTPATGGTSNAPTGGGTTGGTVTGGAPIGGAPTGGTLSGGASSGGAVTGGSPTGGVVSGGALTGGMTTDGGTPTGGWTTGGALVGGDGSSGGVVGDGGTGGIVAAAGASGTGGATVNGGDPKFLLFLLLGQSNMEGAPQPESQDREENARIQVLAYDNCANVGRSYNEWYPASPPLHSCGAGVGPGDYFAKTLIEALPEDYSIGLVPCAVNGAPIDLFRKDVPRTGWELPPDNHWETGYEWIISRAELAQEAGVIRGILFHQGESDSGQSVWVGKVAELVEDLRTDLDLGEVPFLAGELYQDGCCPDHNEFVNELPGVIPNAHVVSSSGLTGQDIYHFDLPSQRALGTRDAQTMQGLLAIP